MRKVTCKPKKGCILEKMATHRIQKGGGGLNPRLGGYRLVPIPEPVRLRPVKVAVKFQSTTKVPKKLLKEVELKGEGCKKRKITKKPITLKPTTKKATPKKRVKKSFVTIPIQNGDVNEGRVGPGQPITD
jgi:hypothetical protein